jgi:hypothetical protein
MQKVKNLIKYLQTYDEDAVVLSFIWDQDLAEMIINDHREHAIELTDEQWADIANRISMKCDWLDDEMGAEITDRYNDVVYEAQVTELRLKQKEQQ